MGSSDAAKQRSQVLKLYDDSRYAEAYSLLDPLRVLISGEGSLRDRLARLPPEDLILAGKILAKLGNHAAIELAVDMAAERPHPREADSDELILSRLHGLSDRNPLQAIRLYEDPDARLPRSERNLCYWHAAGGVLYTAYRDFPRAEAALVRAQTEDPDRPWVRFCRSHMLLRQDNWKAAWDTAREAWLSPAPHPFGAQVLHQAAARLGCLAECMGFLGRIENQSFEVELVRLSTVVWLLDRSGAQAAESVLKAWQEDAMQRVEQARSKAIAADEEVSNHLASVEERVRRRVQTDGRRVLPHTPVFQAYQLCQPAAISTALSSQGIPFDHRPLVSQVTFSGTSTVRARDWLRDHGFEARIGKLSRKLASRLLELGIGFVVSFAGEEQGHSLAAVGYWEEDDVLVLHDPAADHLVETPMEYLLELHRPLGPEVLVVYPSRRGAEVARVWESDGQDPFFELFQEYRQLLFDGRPEAAGMAQRITRDSTDAVIVSLVSVYELQRAGKGREARRELQRLRESWPGSFPLVVETMKFAEYIRDEKEFDELIAAAMPAQDAAVGGGFHSGAEQGPLSAFAWVPQSLHLMRASRLGQSARDLEEALRCVEQALALNQTSSRALSVCAGMLLRHGRIAEAELPSRLALSVDMANEEPAKVRCQYLEASSAPEADRMVMALCEERIRTFGSHPLAGAVWESYLGWAFDKLDAESFAAVLDRVRKARPDLPHGWYCAVLQAARCGQAASLRDLLSSAPPGRWERMARVRLALNGCVWLVPVAEAAVLARQWAHEEPGNGEALWACLQLIRHTEGTQAALAWASSLSEFPTDSSAHLNALYHANKQNHDISAARALLRVRVEENPRDGWAWRELGFLSLLEGDAEAASPCVEQADMVEPASPATLNLKLEHAQARRDEKAAASLLLQGLAHLPPDSFLVQKAVTYLQSLGVRPHEGILDALRRVAGRFPSTRDICDDLLAIKSCTMEVFSCLDWAGKERDSSENQGARDAWALGMVRFILARPFEEELHERAERLANELSPAVGAGIKSWIAAALLERRGRPAQALEQYQRVLSLDPAAAGARERAARLLARLGRRQEALAMVSGGLECLVDNPPAAAGLARLLGDLGAAPRAHAALTALVHRYPNELSVWDAYKASCIRMVCTGKLRGELRAARERAPGRGVSQGLALQEASLAGPQAADRAEAYRKAWMLDQGNAEAADLLAESLAEAGDLVEAGKAAASLPVPTASSRGRLAWLAARAERWQEAYGGMAALLAEHPDYAWGWAVFRGWAGEKKEDAAKSAAFIPALVSLGDVFSVRPAEAVDIISAYARTLDSVPSEVEKLIVSIASAWRGRPELLVRLAGVFLPAAKGSAALFLYSRLRALALESRPSSESPRNASFRRALELLDLGAADKDAPRSSGADLVGQWQELRLTEPLATDLEPALLEACILRGQESSWTAALLTDLLGLKEAGNASVGASVGASEEHANRVREKVRLAVNRSEALAPTFHLAVESASRAAAEPIERARPLFPRIDLLGTILFLMPRGPEWDAPWHAILEALEATDAMEVSIAAWRKAGQELSGLRQTYQYVGYLLLKKNEKASAARWLEGCGSRPVDMWCVYNECIARFTPFESLRKNSEAAGAVQQGAGCRPGFPQSRPLLPRDGAAQAGVRPVVGR